MAESKQQLLQRLIKEKAAIESRGGEPEKSRALTLSIQATRLEISGQAREAELIRAREAQSERKQELIKTGRIPSTKDGTDVSGSGTQLSPGTSRFISTRFQPTVAPPERSTILQSFIPDSQFRSLSPTSREITARSSLIDRQEIPETSIGGFTQAIRDREGNIVGGKEVFVTSAGERFVPQFTTTKGLQISQSILDDQELIGGDIIGPEISRKRRAVAKSKAREKAFDIALEEPLGQATSIVGGGFGTSIIFEAGKGFFEGKPSKRIAQDIRSVQRSSIIEAAERPAEFIGTTGAIAGLTIIPIPIGRIGRFLRRSKPIEEIGGVDILKLDKGLGLAPTAVVPIRFGKTGGIFAELGPIVGPAGQIGDTTFTKIGIFTGRPSVSRKAPRFEVKLGGTPSTELITERVLGGGKIKDIFQVERKVFDEGGLSGFGTTSQKLIEQNEGVRVAAALREDFFFKRTRTPPTRKELTAFGFEATERFGTKGEFLVSSRFPSPKDIFKIQSERLVEPIVIGRQRVGDIVRKDRLAFETVDIRKPKELLIKSPAFQEQFAKTPGALVRQDLKTGLVFQGKGVLGSEVQPLSRTFKGFTKFTLEPSVQRKRLFDLGRGLQVGEKVVTRGAFRFGERKSSEGGRFKISRPISSELLGDIKIGKGLRAGLTDKRSPIVDTGTKLSSRLQFSKTLPSLTFVSTKTSRDVSSRITNLDRDITQNIGFPPGFKPSSKGQSIETFSLPRALTRPLISSRLTRSPLTRTVSVPKIKLGTKLFPKTISVPRSAVSLRSTSVLKLSPKLVPKFSQRLIPKITPTTVPKTTPLTTPKVFPSLRPLLLFPRPTRTRPRTKSKRRITKLRPRFTPTLRGLFLKKGIRRPNLPGGFVTGLESRLPIESEKAVKKLDKRISKFLGT